MSNDKQRLSGHNRDVSVLPLVANPQLDEKQIGKFIVTSEKLGKGTFGRVYLAYDSNTGEKAAVKVVQLKEAPSATSEVYEHRKLLHKHVIRLLAQQKNEKYLVMFFEYCGGGDMAKFVELNGPLPEIAARRFFRQLCKGLSYLNEKNMLHRDLKPANIFLTSKDMFKADVKIADLGFAKTTQNLAASSHGSPAFMAPERIMEQPYGFPAEVFAAGLVLFEMLAGKGPFDGVQTRAELSQRQRAGRYLEHSAIQHASGEAQDVIRRTLKFDPNERITIDDLLKHPFLQRSAAEEQGMGSTVNSLSTPTTPGPIPQTVVTPPQQDAVKNPPPPPATVSMGTSPITPAGSGSGGGVHGMSPAPSQGDGELDLDDARGDETNESATKNAPPKLQLDSQDVSEADNNGVSKAKHIDVATSPLKSDLHPPNQNRSPDASPPIPPRVQHTRTTSTGGGGGGSAKAYYLSNSANRNSMLNASVSSSGSNRVRSLGNNSNLQTGSFQNNLSMILTSMQDQMHTNSIAGAKLVRSLAYEELDPAKATVLYSYCCGLLVDARRVSDEARIIYKECYDQAHHNKQHVFQTTPGDLASITTRPIVALLVSHAARICESAASEELVGRTVCGNYNDSLYDAYSRAFALMTIALSELENPISNGSNGATGVNSSNIFSATNSPPNAPSFTGFGGSVGNTPPMAMSEDTLEKTKERLRLFRFHIETRMEASVPPTAEGGAATMCS